MVTAIVILSLILAVVVVVSIVLGLALFRRVQERDNAIERLDTYRRQWEPMTQYLSRCYHNRYYVTHEGLDSFFAGKGDDYSTWLSQLVENEALEDPMQY